MLTQEQQIEIDNDHEKLMYLKTLVHLTGVDCEEIYRLYKKYIDGRAPQYTTGCMSCTSHIGEYIRTLLSRWGLEKSELIKMIDK